LGEYLIKLIFVTFEYRSSPFLGSEIIFLRQA